MAKRACPLQPLEADGAEEEDGVEQNETEAQPAVQPPAVQMDTQDLRRDGEKEREINFLLLHAKYNSLSLKTETRALRQGKDKMKIICKEKQAADVGADSCAQSKK